MLASALALLIGAASTFELVSNSELPRQTTRNDYDYVGKNITCSVAAYCQYQSELYTATLADNLTYAPRYVISDSLDVVYNSTQVNMTLTMTNNPAITAWQPGNNLIVSLNMY